MAAKTPEEILADASAWWDTSIIDVHPGRIAIRGYAIEELIGRVRFPALRGLMLVGDLPPPGQPHPPAAPQSKSPKPTHLHPNPLDSSPPHAFHPQA